MSGAEAKIYEENECVYDNKESADLTVNNLSNLISWLKNTKIEINEFLTGLVEKREGPVSINDENELTDEESNSDSTKEVKVSSKKRKLVK